MIDDNTDSITQLVTTYISIWNERDPQARGAIGADVLSTDAEYVDPNTSVEGRSAIDTYIGGWQQQFAGMAFVLGDVRSHHHVAHFYWSFGPPGGPPVANGWDVVVIHDGLISKVYGFFS
ncbi:nuclear transport factor 2 family protein [Kribbella sp. C-35]|uniref:nuclear transport factor 2 family protein n=1 Tax=Kribbella sp. C-35 TaxID=2789276 RepID=UPI0039792F6B